MNEAVDETAVLDLAAVVGMAGRFPGAEDVDGLWALMMGRGDSIRPVPPDRWDASSTLDPERTVQGVGGFLDDVGQFDASFFGISPREAVDIDPQQRLILEMTWRALEDAGARAADLAGTRTGVYVGASWHDYELLREDRGARPTQHSLVGNALDVIAARVSYFLGLRGPSLTVETGCSSSLVALHLAVQALRQGEIEAAIVGGVNLIMAPDVSIGLTHFGGLSERGRCAAFGAGADGFVRGEGVAALYLKTVRRALADGDHVHGVVARTVVNNDGGGDSLVTPSRQGQEELLALAYAGDAPLDRLAYVEAHGTGTGRGDPVEAAALGTLGRRHSGGPLRIGSVKTNIGHLEAAAGMAGLVKVLLALRHRIVPPSRHAEALNPEIPFAELNLEVVREPFALPAAGPVQLGVNSFGWGGTNAHVVVADLAGVTPAPVAPPPATGLPPVLALSARQWPALVRRAEQLHDVLPGTDDLSALAGALAWRRDHFPVRAGVVGAGELSRALDAVRTEPEGGSEQPGVVIGRAVPRRRTAFVFPGQGSQWNGMGRDLYRSSPLFADVIERCERALRPHVSWRLLDIFESTGDDGWMSRIDILQPALWAMSLGLAELWRACGVTPDVVLGHSQGEITAATFAGILSYQDGAMIVARRSAIARRASGRGLMLAVDLGREEALAALDGFTDSVSLAVCNGPRSCVLSGDRDAVETLKEILEAEDVFCRMVNVDYASHSQHMDPLRADLLAALSSAAPSAGAIELFSTTRVRPVAGTELDASYWVENLRNPVLFADAMTEVLDHGVTHMVEISPHPVLAPAIEQLTADRPGPPAVLTTLRRDCGDPEAFAQALARAYVAGLEPFGGLPRGQVDLPGYPLRRDRFWPEERRRAPAGVRGLDVVLAPAPGEQDTWHANLELAVDDLPWLADHKVHEAVVLPGAAMLALAVDTARARTGARPAVIADVVFGQNVTLGEQPVRLTAQWRDDIAEGGSFGLLSLPGGAGQWSVNATARVLAPAAPVAPPSFPDWEGGGQSVEPADFYRDCAGRGLGYGPAFQGVRSLLLHPDGSAAIGQVVLADRLRSGNRPGTLQPALWDGAMQVALAVCGGAAAVVPTAVDRVWLLPAPDGPVREVWSHAVRRGPDLVDVQIFDSARVPLVLMEGLRLLPLPGEGADDTDTDLLHYLQWIEQEESPEAVPVRSRWLLCGAAGKPIEQLAEALAGAGAEVDREPDDADLPAGLAGVQQVAFVAPWADAGTGAQRGHLMRLAALVRACADLAVPPRLVVVTAAAQAVTTADLPDPGAALYWGFGRVLRREHGELEPRLIDIDPADPDWARHCAAELVADALADQVALRGDRRLAGRLARGPATEDVAGGLPAPRTPRQSFEVVAARPGFWEGVRCEPLSRRTPGPGEIEVEVTASALNFIDVMKALGVYPDPSGEAGRLGGECAGRVVAIGPGDTDLGVGDRVVACGFGALASHVTVPARHARRIPDTLPDAAAAALPLVLATAWYALVDLGRVAPGETVLIHSAAGGVGLAAVELAGALGARVIATVGSEAKREHLRGLGVTEVFHSRDLTWVDGVRAATGGRGVDVVVNSLAGAAIPLGLDLLAEDGRFIEIGKKDIYGGRSVPMRSFSKGISLAAVDLAGLMLRRPDRFARLLRDCWQLVEDGRMRAPTLRRYPFAEVTEALREMSRGSHIGKFVIEDPGTVEQVTPVPMPGGRFRSDGSYLITGGLGALGLSLAEFLAGRGAGAVILMGRSKPGSAAAARVRALRTAGVQVKVVRCDVADATALARALNQARRALPPLRGVVHAAGVLHDATIRTMTAAQLDEVFAPKVDGATNLDAATAADPLDFFVLFSSAAALVGNAGQAAYAAANAYLDSLAEARRRRGAPALSVQWGPFAQVGLAADDDRRGARLVERGMASFPVGQAWSALVRMLARDEPVVGYVPIDLRRWFDAFPDTAGLDSWEWLRAIVRDGGTGGSGGEFLSRLRLATPDLRAGLVEAKVRELSGRVLRLDPERIDRETPFKELGLDSLLGLELRNRLESAFGLRLSPTLLWTYGNPKALATALGAQLDAAGPVDPAGSAPAAGPVDPAGSATAASPARRV